MESHAVLLELGVTGLTEVGADLAEIVALAESADAERMELRGRARELEAKLLADEARIARGDAERADLEARLRAAEAPGREEALREELREDGVS